MPASSAMPDATQTSRLATARQLTLTITLAPERVPEQAIRALVARARSNAGHTAASYEQARASIGAGITGFTHLYNAMSPLRDASPARSAPRWKTATHGAAA